MVSDYENQTGIDPVAATLADLFRSREEPDMRTQGRANLVDVLIDILAALDRIGDQLVRLNN